MQWLAVLAACGGGEIPGPGLEVPATTGEDGGWSHPSLGAAARPPSIVGEPVVTPAGEGVYLARWFEVRTDLPATLALTVTGPERSRRIEFPGATVHHRVPLLELRAEATYVVQAELVSAGGRAAAPSVEIVTEALPPDLSALQAEVFDRAAMEPGITVFPVIRLDEGIAWLVALDDDGEVVYLRDVPPLTIAVSVLPDGGIALNEGEGAVVVYDPAGGKRLRWTPEPSAPEDVPIEVLNLHHELLVQPDGSFFSLSFRTIEVDEYPTSYADPYIYAPATIEEDLVVHIAGDGSTLAEIPLGGILDTRRIGFNSLLPGKTGFPDWGHANGLHYDPAADQLLVSVRHQDAVISIDRATGALRWIFGHPHGWPPELEPYLLTPTEPFVWPTHQHGIELDDGVLRLFDNGNNGRDTPYYDSGQTGPFYSRILEVWIDESARTVTPVAEYVDTSDGPLYSHALGNADRLPATGNRLGTWGVVPRIVEFAEDGTVVFEVTAPYGWRSDRAIRVPSLYPSDVVVSAE